MTDTEFVASDASEQYSGLHTSLLQLLKPAANEAGDESHKATLGLLTKMNQLFKGSMQALNTAVSENQVLRVVKVVADAATECDPMPLHVDDGEGGTTETADTAETAGEPTVNSGGGAGRAKLLMRNVVLRLQLRRATAAMAHWADAAVMLTRDFLRVAPDCEEGLGESSRTLCATMMATWVRLSKSGRLSSRTLELMQDSLFVAARARRNPNFRGLPFKGNLCRNCRAELHDYTYNRDTKRFDRIPTPPLEHFRPAPSPGRLSPRSASPVINSPRQAEGVQLPNIVARAKPPPQRIPPSVSVKKRKSRVVLPRLSLHQPKPPPQANQRGRHQPQTQGFEFVARAPVNPPKRSKDEVDN